MGFFERIKKEVLGALAAGVFFATGFTLIVLTDRLVGRGTDVHIASFARAIVGGWIAAKVLAVADLLPFVSVFQGRPLIHPIMWKSAIYFAAALVFKYGEDLAIGLYQGLGLGAAHMAALAEFGLARTWAIHIWIAVLLVVFVTLKEVVRVAGKERARRVFFGW
jgi:hypothetical protein